MIVKIRKSIDDKRKIRAPTVKIKLITFHYIYKDDDITAINLISRSVSMLNWSLEKPLLVLLPFPFSSFFFPPYTHNTQQPINHRIIVNVGPAFPCFSPYWRSYSNASKMDEIRTWNLEFIEQYETEFWTNIRARLSVVRTVAVNMRE